MIDKKRDEGRHREKRHRNQTRRKMGREDENLILAEK